MSDLYTYRIFFNGRYPVGAVAVVVASSPSDAASVLMDELAMIGLEKDNTFDDLVSSAALLNTRERGAYILLDGDY